MDERASYDIRCARPPMLHQAIWRCIECGLTWVCDEVAQGELSTGKKAFRAVCDEEEGGCGGKCTFKWKFHLYSSRAAIEAERARMLEERRRYQT